MSVSTAELIVRAKEGDETALSRLVEENTGLVRSIAVRFMGRGVDYDDLCQIGHIGMIKAIRNFDLERGTAFSTYAVPLIIGEIKRFLRDDGEIKVGREIKRKAAILCAAREKYISCHQNEPAVSVLAEICGFSEEEVVECLGATAGTVSLSEQVGEDGKLEDFIGIDFTPEINEKIALKQAIEKLPDIEREIIYLRYFKGMTQSEAGRILGLTQVGVSRKEAKALLRLKEELK
ncbi:MAG: sigma-70 family RNA polymerase sigma factor [Ruminococcaceae bacterium]|nr:sigma-70 family RNA polymerase sigma factor [Oscillospiraceae bacterium]